MQLFSETPNFNFMGHRRPALIFSAVLIAISLLTMVFRGFNLGIDFTGGLLLELSYGAPVSLDSVREVIAEQGFENATVQNFGTAADVLIRLPPVDDPGAGEVLANQILSALREENASVQLMRTEFVGPQVGEDLTEQGGLAMLFAVLMIFGYVMVRFRWKFAAGAIVGLIHDVIITLGFFSILGLQFDLTILAAVLTVLGYSLNDTIVVFDRVRENFRLIRRGTAEQIMNSSLNQTLARTLVTGISTLLVLTALAALGGQAVSGFAIAVIVGVIIGTYSTIYVASAAALALDVSPADLMPPKREEVDALP